MLTDTAHNELQFWHTSLERWNGCVIWQKPSAVHTVYSDASDVAYGGYTVDVGTEVAHGQVSAIESAKSSTWRELQALYRVLGSFAATLADCQVRWFTDNQDVARIVHHGSNKHELQDAAVQIFHRCVVNNLPGGRVDTKETE